MTPGSATDAGAFSAALHDPALPCPAGLRAWNGSDPGRRFDVHRNNVVASLVAAVAGTFPVVRELVGDEFFDTMAAAFVRRHPPQSRVLAEYGADFAGFVEGFEPARAVPCLADIARLEWARVHALHAADAAAATREDVERRIAQAGSNAGSLRIELHPSVSLLSSVHAVVSIWLAHQGHGALQDVDPGRSEQALVLRDGLEVHVLPLEPAAAACIGALLRGEPLDAAAAAGAGIDAAFDLAAALSPLFAHGAVQRVVPLGEERA